MRTFDFTPIYRSAIGFDRVAQLFDEALRSESTPGYPPYNIELVAEDQYRIVMAVAGFRREEIDMELNRDSLKVTGKKQRGESRPTYLHNGIAARDFEHTFRLADHVHVEGASLENGLLNIELKREVPDALKPRKIAINGDNVTYLENQAA